MLEMATKGETIRVLHVDDQPDFAEMAAIFLERADERFDVETVLSPSEAIDRLAEDTFDCVVSDYDMPRQNGIEFLRTVRERDPDLPFILFTGKGSEEIASDAISAGVTDYLQKESGTEQYAILANRIKNSVEKYDAQRSLADRQQRLNLFFEQSPLGVIEWDENFDFARMNGTAEEILGYSETELAGKSWDAVVPENDRDAVAEVVANLLENKGGYHSVNENVRKDGERIVCEWHNRVATDDDGEIVAIFSLFQDVTERRKDQRRLETLIDNLPGMVYRCQNEKGWPMEHVRGEVEALTGYEPSEIENRGGVYGDRIIHQDDRDDVWDGVQSGLGANGSFELTYRIVTKDGDVKRVWERGQGVYSSGGELEALEGFITDFAERASISE